MKLFHLLSLFLLALPVYSQTKSDNLLNEANGFFNAGNFQKAHKLYDKSIRANPENLEAYFWRGRTRIELNDLEGAKKDFGKVLSVKPDHYGSLVNRGNVFSIQNDFQLAFDDFSRAEKINDGDKDLYLNRGKTYFKMKKYDKAITDYSRAITLSPNETYPYHKRAECYNYAGNIALAIEDLEKILELNGEDNEAKTNLAFCFISIEQFQDANILYEQLYQDQNDNPYVLSNFGYVKHRLGKTEEGLKLISKSLEIMSGNAYAYKYLAEIYLDQKETKKACEAIQTGLGLGFTNQYGTELEKLKESHCK